jgi:hypothetical protein
LRPAHRSKLASGPGIAAPDDGHALLEADQRFQAAPDQAIAKGRERIEAVEATVQLIVLSQKNFTSIMLENQIFVEIHWPAEGCDESRKNGG